MTHPALDPEAIERFKRRIGRAPAPAAVSSAVAPAEPADLVGRAKRAARKAATPVVHRLRRELARASSEDHAAVRAELHELRQELARTRADHDAELAVLHEQLRRQPDPTSDPG